MARRTSNVNGTHTNGDVLPSTLAAQIVQNQTTAVPQQNGDTPTFAELLQEILNNHNATPETDVHVNVKLISVVAQAGLGPLTDGNPFAQIDNLLDQATDSLTVIESTIRQQPEVLFTNTGANGPQLLLPLLARLLAICGREKCHDLPITRLLDSMFSAISASIDLWQDASSLQQVIESCVNDLLSALETGDESSDEIVVKLPPARSVAQLWSHHENAIALPQGCQTSVTSTSHAFMLAVELSRVSRLPTAWRREVELRLQKLFPQVRVHLFKSDQVQLALQRLLTIAANMSIMEHVVVGMANDLPPTQLQLQIATALMDALRSNGNEVADYLLDPLWTLSSCETFDRAHEDLKIAISTMMCRFIDPAKWPERIRALYTALKQDNFMTDSTLSAAFQQLSTSVPTRCTGPKRQKRRKISPEHDYAPSASIRQRIAKIFFGVETNDLTGLAEVAPNAYNKFNQEEQCAAWQALTELAFADPTVTVATISQLIDLPELHQAKRPRILSILAMHAYVSTSTDSTFVDLRESAFGQLCLRSLHSSVRELRIAAAQCLPAFLRRDLPNGLKAANRKVALEYLRVLSDRDVPSEQETLIIAWGFVATVCDASELNLILFRLVDYLGHANPLISGLAFLELEKVAFARSQSPEELFRPFWSSIAVSVVQDIQSRPQKAQQLCDLLGIDVNRWLIQTEQETIPSLVLTKKKDILQRVALAHGNGSTIQDICLQPRTNLASILALLLAQPGQDAEDAALACLAEVSPDFQGSDISDFVKIDSTLIACYMLKNIGDLADSKKSRGYQAFQTFANIAERRPGQSKAHSKSSRTMNDFLENHILGIMTHFSAVLENAQAAHPIQEKIRTLKAIREMVNLNKHRVGAALPQIRAALQSAMEHDALCEMAFSAWLTLLSVLHSEDIAHVIDQSFALVLRHWDKLSSELQQTIHERIGDLVKNHNQVIQENIMTLPSLRSISLLAKYGSEIDRLKSQEGVEVHCKAFANRLRNESKIVVLQSLQELIPWLEENQEFMHESSLSEQPVTVIHDLLRALLDATAVYSEESEEAAEMCGKALGIIGSLDPNRLEVIHKKRRVLVLSNFDKASEVIDWAIVLLEDILVKAFKSVSNSRAQGFLAYVMQELLRFCEFSDEAILRLRGSQASSAQQKWQELPENVRITLTPFVKSRYVVASNVTITAPNRTYPNFTPDSGYSNWLRSLVYDLMWKAKGENAKMVFPLLARIIRGHDLAIANFMLPYAILNVVLGGTVADVKGVSDEIQAVLGCQPTNTTEQECVKLCSESVFNALDYMSTWLQEKRKIFQETRNAAFRQGHTPSDFDEIRDQAQIDTIECFLASIPAEVIATQAVLCGSYARALFHWEQYIREQRPLIPTARPPKQFSDDEMQYDKLLNIYAQIDEPDGLEGISAHLPLLNEEQQAMQHVKSGRWTAAQAWFESQLADVPQHIELEERLLSCLRETGRYAPLLRYADSFISSRHLGEDAETVNKTLLPTLVEAHWMIGDVDGMMTRLQSVNAEDMNDFNVGIARILRSAAQADHESLTAIVMDLRKSTTQSMTVARTGSIQASHEELKKLHVLHEIEALSSGSISKTDDPSATLDRRLSVVGSYVSDKQYILGIRRAVMGSFHDTFDNMDLGSSWLTTAKLARQMGNTQQAYDAVLQANDCGDKTAKLEEARLLWSDGHQRHAIQALESSIASGIFEAVPSEDTSMRTDQSGISSIAAGAKQNMLSARANLLLAKWLDRSGQSQAKDMTDKYQFAARHFQRWEKGHYYLGKHYQKLLDAEKAMPKGKQTQQFQSGELTRLVIENLLRSVPFGNKYWHQTIPKLLTLWLDLGLETLKMARGEDQSVFDRRVKSLHLCNKQLQKYFDRVPPYVFFSAIPQMISRITHPNPEVWKQLSNILVRIVSTHPSQALWSLLAVIKSSDKLRNDRGMELLNRLKDPKNVKTKVDGSGLDLRVMITQARKLSEGLLHACEAPVEPRAVSASLSKDLGFNHKLAPCPLVVPLEHTLTPNLPAGVNSDIIRKHKAFVQDKITVQSFADYVLVLSSLQRPRKLTVRGSDGKNYGLLCKPKDDLRKDQRLMEFNGIINRALKRDAESSKRRLYIKTYAVTPLSEESGTIEWVEGIKPIRDILLNVYARKNIKPNYGDLRRILDEASTSPDKAHLFVEKILPGFPASLHEWFTEVYPEPDAWFAARLRYARSAAVMSMTGHVLGLGDRHGENILLEESTGGVFHVDFNCLFDKGLTFEKPELVPFRLTHNMVDAMGPYGYEGPFRKSCELTMKLLRQSKDTLMTVLETFLYDPTTDFVGKKKRSTHGVPETPQEILESVDNKLKGLLRGESVPLGVEGYVDALIREAVSPWCLASMYIGWCAFL